MHESSEECEIQLDRTNDCGVNYPWASEKNPHRLIMGKRCCHFFSAILDRIHFILAGNDDIHESLDDFEIWPDPTTGSHGNIKGYNGKKVCHFFSAVFIRSFSYLQVMMTCMRARRSVHFCQIGKLTAELAALERVKKFPYTYNGIFGVATFSRLFLIGSISYLQVTITYVRAWMSLKFGQIPLLISMAIDRVIMAKTVLPLFLVCLLSDPFHTCR